MNLITTLILNPRDALVINGRLYFFMGIWKDMIPITGNTLTRRRGKSRHFAIDLEKNRLIIFEDLANFWFLENADDISAEIWHDILRSDVLDTASDPRRFELTETPQQFELTRMTLTLLSQSYLRSVLVNGRVVTAMSSAKMIDEAAALYFPTFTAVDPNDASSTGITVFRNSDEWDGNIYRLGKMAWALTEKDAERSYRLLNTSAAPFADWWSRLRTQGSGLR